MSFVCHLQNAANDHGSRWRMFYGRRPSLDELKVVGSQLDFTNEDMAVTASQLIRSVDLLMKKHQAMRAAEYEGQDGIAEFRRLTKVGSAGNCAFTTLYILS